MIFRPSKNDGEVQSSRSAFIDAAIGRGDSRPAKKRACSLRIQYQHSGSARRGSLARCCSNRLSSNCSIVRTSRNPASSRAVSRISPSCAVMMSMTRPKRALAREIEAVLDFPLHLARADLRSREVGVQVVAAIGRKGEVADLVRGLEGAAHQIAAALDVSRPGMTRSRTTCRCGPGSGATHASRPDRSRAGRSGIRPRSCRSAVRRSCRARHRRSTTASLLPCSRLRLTMRQMTSESRFSSVNNAGVTTSVRTSRVASASGSRHQGQVDELLDRAAPEPRPDPLVFSPHLVSRRMR